MISLICGTKKNDTNELIYKTQTDSQIQKTNNGYQRVEGIEERQDKGMKLRYKLLCINEVKNLQGYIVQCREYNQ